MLRAFALLVAVGTAVVHTGCAVDEDSAILHIDNGNNDSFTLLVNGESYGSVDGCSRGTEIVVDVQDPCANVVAEAPWAIDCQWACLDLTAGQSWNPTASRSG